MSRGRRALYTAENLLKKRPSLLKKSLAELYGKKNIGNRTFSSQLLASTFCRDFVSYFIVFFFPSC